MSANGLSTRQNSYINFRKNRFTWIFAAFLKKICHPISCYLHFPSFVMLYIIDFVFKSDAFVMSEKIKRHYRFSTFFASLRIQKFSNEISKY